MKPDSPKYIPPQNKTINIQTEINEMIEIKKTKSSFKEVANDYMRYGQELDYNLKNKVYSEHQDENLSEGSQHKSFHNFDPGVALSSSLVPGNQNIKSSDNFIAKLYIMFEDNARMATITLIISVFISYTFISASSKTNFMFSNIIRSVIAMIITFPLAVLEFRNNKWEILKLNLKNAFIHIGMGAAITLIIQNIIRYVQYEGEEKIVFMILCDYGFLLYCIKEMIKNSLTWKQKISLILSLIGAVVVIIFHIHQNITIICVGIIFCILFFLLYSATNLDTLYGKFFFSICFYISLFTFIISLLLFLIIPQKYLSPNDVKIGTILGYVYLFLESVWLFILVPFIVQKFILFEIYFTYSFQPILCVIFNATNLNSMNGYSNIFGLLFNILGLMLYRTDINKIEFVDHGKDLKIIEDDEYHIHSRKTFRIIN